MLRVSFGPAIGFCANIGGPDAANMAEGFMRIAPISLLTITLLASTILMAQVSASSPQVKRIAVYDFDDRAVASEVKEAYGEDKRVGALVAREVVARLVNSGAFDVIDRSQIDKILKKERAYHDANSFNGGEAGQLGKMLNVDGIVTGTVETVSSQVNKSVVGVGLASGGKRDAEADVSVTILVMSTHTARIFLAGTANEKEKHSLGTGGGYGAKNGSGSTADAQHPGAYPLTLALQRAADELADKIIAKSASLPTLYDVSARSTLATTGGKALSRVSASGSTMTGVGSSFSPSTAAPAPSLTLMIGKVDGRKLYITGGSNAGVTLNQAIEVRRMSGTMKDASGVDIPIEETVEVAVITDVEDRYSVAELQHGDKSEAKIGDKVKLLQTVPKEEQKSSEHRSKLPWKH